MDAYCKSSLHLGSNTTPPLPFGAATLAVTGPNDKPGLRVDNDARTGMPFGIPKGAMCVQRFDDSLEFCNSHYLSHFAAFFIDARTKRSVVESFALFNHKLRHMTRFIQRLNWLSAGAGQRTPLGGPPAVVRRARRSNRGSVNKGLGGRAWKTLTR